MTKDELLAEHLRLVLEYNQNINLTRISSWEEGWLLHVQDSLLGLDAVTRAPEGKYADIGTGAGYPGIPLAIETGRDTLLVDSVAKKIKVVQAMVDQLGLAQVSTVACRIEDLGKERAGEFAVVTARALSKLSVLMELAAPLLKQTGCLVAYKAQVGEEELKHAKDLQAKLNMWLVSDESFLLQGKEEDFQRRILVFEKRGEPKIKLPRKMGFAQKRPL